MKIRILTATLATLFLTAALHATDSKETNPALLYWQAAAQLPQLTADQAKVLHAMAAGRQPFDPAKAPNLADDNSGLRFLRKAADSTAPCDWGLAVEDGPFMALPHLSKMRELSSLALVKAEALFAAGQVKEGLDWALVAHRVARHAGAGGLLISFLVQEAIEENALRTAARHCLAWDEATRRAYAAALQTLPPLHSEQDAYRGESIFPDWLEHHFNAPDTSPRERGELAKMMTPQNLQADVEAFNADCAPGVLPSALAEFRALQARVIIALGKPWPESHAELQALDNEATHSAHIIVRTTFPVAASVAGKQFQIATLRTMLDAALQHGAQLDEAAAATYHDAFEGEPLRLKKAGDGSLTLIAAHQHPAGKDLDLQLGK